VSLVTVTQTMIYVRNAWAMAETGWGWGSAGSRTAWGRCPVMGWLEGGCVGLRLVGGRTRGSWVLSLRAWDCVASARRGLPWGRKIYLLT
jgi:hypothetical protein